jgi:hypothetical protein
VLTVTAIVVLLVVFGVVLVPARRGSVCGGRRGVQTFDRAWIGLFAGLALLFTRAFAPVGMVLAAVSFAAITLPMARAEWNARVERSRAAADAERA